MMKNDDHETQVQPLDAEVGMKVDGDLSDGGFNLDDNLLI
jgi:hypothetical protein